MALDSNKIIWKYSPATPIVKLRAHHRWTCWLAQTMLISTSIFFSMLFEFVIRNYLEASDATPTLNDRVTLYVMAVSSMVSAVTLLPGIIAIFWAKEIQNELRLRGVLPTNTAQIDKLLVKVAMKASLAVLLTMVVVSWFCRASAT